PVPCSPNISRGSEVVRFPLKSWKEPTQRSTPGWNVRSPLLVEKIVVRESEPRLLKTPSSWVTDDAVGLLTKKMLRMIGLSGVKAKTAFCCQSTRPCGNGR